MILNDLSTMIHEQNENYHQREHIYIHADIFNFGASEHINWIEKLTRQIQQQSWSSERMNKQTQKHVICNYPGKLAKRMKRILKAYRMYGILSNGPLHNTGVPEGEEQKKRQTAYLKN